MKTRGNKVFTFQSLHDKEKRSLAILELIRKKGIISRADISRATGINVVSVSNYINSFIEKNIVLEKGHAESSGGRKPELVELNAKESLCVGVDICDGSISAVLTDITMKVAAKKKAPRPEKRRNVADAVISLIEDVVRSAAAPKENIKAIGIGICDERLLAVRDAVENKFNIDTLIGPAAACGACAEKTFNPEAAAGKLLFIYSDLCHGVFIEGDTYTGYVGSHDETGGAPEAAASGASARNRYLAPWSPYLGMVETAKREVARGVGTKIVSLSGGDIEKITEEVTIAAARQKDETALNIVQSVSINMGLRVAYLINLFGPDTVVVGGGPEKAQEITFPLINKMVKRLSLKKYIDDVKIISCALGAEGLYMGAAALAVREVFLKS